MMNKRLVLQFRKCFVIGRCKVTQGLAIEKSAI